MNIWLCIVLPILKAVKALFSNNKRRLNASQQTGLKIEFCNRYLKGRFLGNFFVSSIFPFLNIGQIMAVFHSSGICCFSQIMLISFHTLFFTASPLFFTSSATMWFSPDALLFFSLLIAALISDLEGELIYGSTELYCIFVY